MSDPSIDKLANVLGSLRDLRDTNPAWSYNIMLAERLAVLSDMYAEMQQEVAEQARELAALRDRVTQMAAELEEVVEPDDSQS